jgi:hypothetical protein
MIRCHQEGGLKRRDSPGAGRNASQRDDKGIPASSGSPDAGEVHRAQ